MEDHPPVQQKTVPPLKIKNVRSLHNVHISDEEDPYSAGTGSTSENDSQLVIDEMPEPVVIKDEPFIIEYEQNDVAYYDTSTTVHRTARKRIRAPKPKVPDSIMVIDGDAMGSDEYEQVYYSTSASNRNSINSEESYVVSGAQSSSTSGHSSKTSRRKSHHVPKQVGDVVFEEATILTVDDEDGTNDDGTSSSGDDPNRYLMKNIAMLKTCINYVLDSQNCRPMPFKHNYESTAKMIEHYNQMNMK